jgi:hypothetical protein
VVIPKAPGAAETAQGPDDAKSGPLRRASLWITDPTLNKTSSDGMPRP